MITTREQAKLKASINVGEAVLRVLALEGLTVIAADELAALDTVYETHKHVQQRCTELLEEARAARREARRWQQLAMAAGEKLVDAADLAATEAT